ncbi:hypothetical protein [Methanobrevibacter millerae]|uniref:Uncharacterized protein n=1 Tax=Methanobrevibacter millerae TaxID=230361 RepID=A0A0U3E5P1_9EURY|nr:hypothetical protein [Methanobrevibacter millerae]ALT69319.1 hypothetical protein sm9_1550 [Methanobrevibacter millerae]
MMKKIQLINNNGYYNLNNLDITLSSIHSFSDIELFDYNIIDLNLKELWIYNTEERKFKEDKNIKTLTETISENDNIIIILPSNDEYVLESYLQNENNQLKNDSEIITTFLRDYFNIAKIILSYGKNETNFGDYNLEADFYFKEISNFNIITKNIIKKPTTIKRRNITLTTLQLHNGQDIENFINLIFETNENIPKWFDNIEMFDDKEQKSLIDNNKQQILSLEKEISISETKLQENNYYKSILYEQGKPLEKVVRDILQDMLKKDLSKFKDIGNEDFLIEFPDITFIGEIKGVSRNLINSHLGELNLNYEKRRDLNNCENLKPLLIINRFRKYSPEKRKPVENEQIELAKTKYGILIITVESLLEIYDEFKKDNITCEEIKEMFKDEIGLLKYPIL